MIYSPPDGEMWDPSVIRHDGTYYLFAMRGNVMAAQPSCWSARSRDGVHWEHVGNVIDDPDKIKVFKMFVGRCGERFIMNHGSFTTYAPEDTRQDRLRFYESDDLAHWRFLHDSWPDERWYTHRRWDHMYMIPKEEGNPAAGYWGYVVAVPTEQTGCASYGMMQSVDGADWEALPPPKIDWGDVAPTRLEVGGCERIDGRYYLIGGTCGHAGNAFYSMFTMVADDPTGPFVPDTDAYRLCGSSGYGETARGVQWLASFCRCGDELLLSQYIHRVPGQWGEVWMLPLRRVVTTDGHLRMGYWPGNDAAKGAAVALTTREIEIDTGDPDACDAVMLDPPLNLEAGAILEGTLTAAAGRAGFYIEQSAGLGTAALLTAGEADGRESHIGLLRLSGNDEGFKSLDVTGPGCATVTGVEPGKRVQFRLWIRRNMFEIYIDDLLFQSFTVSETSGCLGLVAQNTAATFGALKAWQMNL